jgi:N-acetylated-alpha-linked acidic dipeptidase
LPPMAKAEVPFLNFGSLQNAVATFAKSADALNAISGNTMTADKKNELNKQLYRAEQVLLTKDGLPRRGWYKHAIYAPGFFTGYGVKTLPGITEAIEQRNWKEAQEQIEIAAATINNFAVYLDAATMGAK